MNASPELGNLAEALAKAQSEFGDVTKDKTAKAGSYSYSYADLADVLKAVRKPLSDNGLALVQATAFEDRPYLVTRLIHASGEWIEGVYPLRDYDKPQDMGSALTYARRYAVTSLLGIAAEDDDGQAAQGGKDGQQGSSQPQRQNASASPARGRSGPSSPPSVPVGDRTREGPPPVELQEEVAPPAPGNGGPGFEGKDPGPPSAGLKTKRALLKALAKGKRVDLEEHIKPIGKSFESLDETDLDTLIDELKEAS